MSSLVDAVINSDNPDFDLAAALSSDGGPSRQRPTHRSSSRPRGPPSESNNGNLSDAAGFPDDEVVGLRGDRLRPRNPFDRAVPRVVDQIGEVVQLRFEEFLES